MNFTRFELVVIRFIYVWLSSHFGNGLASAHIQIAHELMDELAPYCPVQAKR